MSKEPSTGPVKTYFKTKFEVFWQRKQLKEIQDSTAYQEKKKAQTVLTSLQFRKNFQCSLLRVAATFCMSDPLLEQSFLLIAY